MKNLLIAIFCMPALMFAQGIEFFEGDWKEALALADKEEKLVFVDAYAKWCGPCKRMAAQSFTNEELGEFHSANFISMKMDMEEPYAQSFRQKYPVAAYPTIFYLDGKGEIVKKVTGYRTAEQLVMIGKGAVASVDRTGDLKAEYDKGNRDYDLMLKYVTELNKVGKPSLKISNEYLKSKPDISHVERLDFLYAAVVDSDSRLFQQMITEKEYYIKKYGADVFEEKIKKSCNATVKKAVDYEYPELLDEAIANMKVACPNNASKYDIEAKKSYALSLAQLDDWLDLNKKYLKKYGKNDVELYKASISESRKAFGNNPKAKEATEDYCKSLLKIDDKTEHYFTYVKILLEHKKNAEAEKMAEEALKKATAKGEDTKKLEGMLEYIKSI